MVLTAEQREQFHRDGCAISFHPLRYELSPIVRYLVIRGFVAPEDVRTLLGRSKELLQEFSLEDHPLTKFTTGDDDGEGHIGDAYFLESGDKIRYFLEEDAVVDGKLNRPKDKAVNKIGHGTRCSSSTLAKVTLENERMRTLVRDLQFHRDPIALQSMVITKQPQIVGEHNDSKCTAENGALSFLPGSHLTTPITKRFVRLPEGGTGFEPLVTAERIAAPANNAYILETCEPGDLVLIHGAVVHKSERNTSDKTRFAYTFHMIEAGAKYDEKNWLQPTAAMPFSRILA
ncbi:phytanoyl-CoA dioxygenase [Mycena metata]|uniref:Phytanoyl-CoA dioxygenase n=1 Tax=Mycena metata TaxID=1033252 RepID=A0AAD7KD21_9AGAR|nr:phytanoyl-CoA dioxygenase [Mycena metata]